MVVIKLHTEKPIPPLQVIRLYQDVDWWPARSKDGVRKLLGHGVVLGAWEDKQLVGFCRAVSDGVYRAYVEDVVVLGTHRGRGIGRQLMDRMMRELNQIEVVSLFCSGKLSAYYEGSGFKPTGQVVMHRSK
ncbi:GNAT family N-acetyltransferase [Saccharibacillus sp. CPCC 101409]|uniref:GNAT family N-acetyltransferase n=1 Tax=Saccharibacillus sp. CPCC 101409 TaxID=3058041 RepID=UPI0026723ADD|nr:GNAT family N-acetyltransferase [Saccharibacillus sp. CPCC 101409]MDO3410871.1 GNAT family N-acetyltransferase [Saccharibacillus sp. CPCC 101409]